MIEKFEKYWLVLLKYHLKLHALERHYIKPIQTNTKNQYWNNNKHDNDKDTIGFNHQKKKMKKL